MPRLPGSRHMARNSGRPLCPPCPVVELRGYTGQLRQSTIFRAPGLLVERVSSSDHPILTGLALRKHGSGGATCRQVGRTTWPKHCPLLHGQAGRPALGDTPILDVYSSRAPLAIPQSQDSLQTPDAVLSAKGSPRPRARAGRLTASFSPDAEHGRGTPSKADGRSVGCGDQRGLQALTRPHGPGCDDSSHKVIPGMGLT